MPEINPYESPQSDVSHQHQSEPRKELGYPNWVKTALNVQFALVLACFVFAMFVTGMSLDLPTILLIAAESTIVVLTICLFVAAIRYRIGWILFIELFLMFALGFPFLLK